MIISIIWRLDKEWYEASLHFLHNIDQRVSEGTTCIDTSLSKELGLVTFARYALFSKVTHISNFMRFEPLNDLPIYAVLAFMINVTLISVFKRFASIDAQLNLLSFI